MNAKALARHEFIGMQVRIADSSDPTLVGRKGTVVDESRNMLVLESAGKEIRVAKDVVTLAFDDIGIMMDGRKIRYRPEDRIKKVR